MGEVMQLRHAANLIQTGTSQELNNLQLLM